MDDTVDEVIMSAPATINRLDQLVEERSWESVIAHLQTKQGREDARGNASMPSLYHDYEFYKHAPFHVIEALLKAFPDGILWPNYENYRYPIEYAVSGTKKETRNMVFKLFVETNPKCLDNCRDGFFYHHLGDITHVRFFQRAFDECDNTEVLKWMIETNPNFLYHSKYPYFLPMILACYNAQWEKIDLLLDYDPSLAQQVEEGLKWLPLHIACHAYDEDEIFNMETFRRLIEAYPQAAKEKDAEGRLPLHYACEDCFYRSDYQDFVSGDFVSEVLKIYPEAVQIRDQHNNLPLHCLLKTLKHVSYHGHGYVKVLEKQLVALIETYPDSLLQSNGENQLVLGKLAKCECPLRKVWHTAGRLCTHAFICATQESLQPLSQISCESPHPLYHMPFDLIALVENFMDCPLDWTQNEGALQDGELAGVILYYTFKALLEENHGLDSNSKIPLSHNLVMPCLPVYNNYTTVKTNLLHMLAYCSKFCAQHQMEHAVDLYASQQSAHFFQSDNNGNLPLHLVCCAPPPSILVGVYYRRFREKTEARLVETFFDTMYQSSIHN